MKISIITDTFNSGRTVRDTMESVLRQTYTDFEYIIKDGGSDNGGYSNVFFLSLRYFYKIYEVLRGGRVKTKG